MKHPSTLYKKLVRGVLLLAFIAVALILGNRLGILSHSVKNAGSAAAERGSGAARRGPGGDPVL